MADTIIDGTQFDCSKIMYTTPKVTAQGGKTIRLLNKETKTSLRISTPLMLTWGLSDYVDQATQVGNGRFEMSLQFPIPEYKTEETDLFFENMKKMEDKIKNDALTYSKDWFGKQHKSLEIIEELFTPMLKYPKIKGTSEPDYSKSPSLRLKVPNYDGKFNIEIYDEERQKLFPKVDNPTTPLEYLKKGTNVACLIQCTGIWFISGKFGLTWQLVQSIVQKPRESIVGKCYIKINAKDKEKLKNQKVEENEEEEEDSTNIQVVDSDEEDNDKELYPVNTEKVVEEKVEEEMPKETPKEDTMFEPEPVPVATTTPAPKKRVVKKSTVNP